jgi:hypothetical protein
VEQEELENQVNEPESTVPHQMMALVGSIVLAVMILASIWIIKNDGFGPSSTLEPTEIAQSEDWPAIGSTFTPTPTFTPPGPTNTPSPTPTETSTPTPSPTPSPTPRVINIQELGHLTSVEFTTVTIVDLEKERTISNPIGVGPESIGVGTDRILMEAVGKIEFGIDLKQVNEADIRVSGNDVKIVLPRAEVTGVELLPGQTRIHETDKSLLLSEYEGMETEALDKGRMQLENWAKGEGNLINIAEQLARLQLQEFLYSLGFEKVEITFKEQGF